MDQSSVSTVDKAIVTWHRIVEAFKHAYSLRTHLGDNNVGSQSFKDYVNTVRTRAVKTCEVYRISQMCKKDNLPIYLYT